MDSTAKHEPATGKEPTPAYAGPIDSHPILTREGAWWDRPCPLFFWDDDPADEAAEPNLVTTR